MIPSNKNKQKTIPLKQSVSRQRLLWPDVVRIIAIYFVIQVHTPYTQIHNNFIQIILNKLDVMGVPLFVLLSGALLLGKTESYRIFLRKRCLKVLIPWIIWTFLYMIYYFNFHHSSVISDFFSDNRSMFSQWFHFFFRTFMSSLYFLPMIFSGSYSCPR